MSNRFGWAAAGALMLAATPAAAVDYAVDVMFASGRQHASTFEISSQWPNLTGFVNPGAVRTVSYPYPLVGHTARDGEVRVQVRYQEVLCDATFSVTFTSSLVSNTIACGVKSNTGCNPVAYGGGGSSFAKDEAPPGCLFSVGF